MSLLNIYLHPWPGRGKVKKKKLFTSNQVGGQNTTDSLTVTPAQWSMGTGAPWSAGVARLDSCVDSPCRYGSAAVPVQHNVACRARPGVWGPLLVQGQAVSAPAAPPPTCSLIHLPDTAWRSAAIWFIPSGKYTYSGLLSHQIYNFFAREKTNFIYYLTSLNWWEGVVSTSRFPPLLAWGQM